MMVMMEKNVVNELDYEVYNFHLPLSILLKGRKKQFIYSELEKRHPGFSEDWSFNAKYELNRKGIDSKVLVMRKMKLAEYKSLAGMKSLTFENREKNKTEKWKLNEFSKEFFVILCFSLISSALFFVKEKYRNNKAEQVKSESVASVEVDDLVHEGKVESFLESCEISNGIINSFDWSFDGVYEHFNCFVKNVFPENLKLGDSDAEYSAITYDGHVPEFSVSFADYGKIQDLQKSEGEMKAVLSETEVFRSIRECMRSFGIYPVEENYERCSVKFVCNKYESENQNHRSFFGAMDELCRSLNFCVTQLFWRKTSENGENELFSGELSFSQNNGYVDGIDFSVLEAKKSLFIKEPVKNKKSKNTSVLPKQQVNRGMKVGEIKHPDGTISVFYKNEEGKIICVN